MNWLQSVLYGFLTGASDVLPVSSRAHGILLLKIFGTTIDGNLMQLFLHLAAMLAIYMSSRPTITRIRRALALKRIPKRRRRRPLDTKSLMDFRLLRTTAVPIVLAYLFYDKLFSLGSNMMLVAFFLLLNGLIIYIPRFLPTGNKDARTMSRVEGLLIGLGGALSIFPGISAMGAMLSVNSVCGVDKEYSLGNALLETMLILLCVSVNDILRIASTGLKDVTFQMVLVCLVTALAAFVGTLLGMKLLKTIAKNGDFSIFSFYCLGLALFTFFLNLIA